MQANEYAAIENLFLYNYAFNSVDTVQTVAFSSGEGILMPNNAAVPRKKDE